MNRLKNRIKSITENKKNASKTIFLGIIALSILAVVVVTNKLTSKNLNLVDSSKINEVTISVMTSPPKKKTIDSNEDIKKIVDYINSIKFKDKKQEVYKGCEVNIKLAGKENYDISFRGDYIYINGIQYTVSSKEIDRIKILYYSMDYEERDIVSNEVMEDGSENLNFYSLTEELMDKNIEVKLIEEKPLSTKDNGYSADFYTIEANDEEVKIYEYSDERAALSEITLFNGDDYHETSYDTDYILIDMEELLNAKEVYLKNKIICLYNGNNTKIKKALSSSLGESLARQSKDSLRISAQDITLIYPYQWIGVQEPIQVVIGEETYMIDTNKIKKNKNTCEMRINNGLLERMRTFDEDKLIIKWKDKIVGDNNKTFLTEINRKDFIRVVKIKGGYVDSSLLYPEIEIDTNDKEIIGEKLYEEYIKMHSTNWFFNLNNGINEEPELSVSESKINFVKLISEGENIFTVDISYDIKAANEHCPWYAGNGVIEEDNWIRRKGTFLDIEKTGENKYRIISGYTG